MQCFYNFFLNYQRRDLSWIVDNMQKSMQTMPETSNIANGPTPICNTPLGSKKCEGVKSRSNGLGVETELVRGTVV